MKYIVFLLMLLSGLMVYAEYDRISQEKGLFKGSYFEIKYPHNFKAMPESPIIIIENNIFIETDEAYFTSPDNSVEFYVFSPLWSGDPEYLDISENEKLIGEEIQEIKENERDGQIGDREIIWRTVRAKDGLYYRSIMSIREQIGTGSELHRVFGIRYKDQTAYEKYKDEYLRFRESLIQYAD